MDLTLQCKTWRNLNSLRFLDVTVICGPVLLGCWQELANNDNDKLASRRSNIQRRANFSCYNVNQTLWSSDPMNNLLFCNIHVTALMATANLPNQYNALCWRPVTHAQTLASYSALYRFGRFSEKCQDMRTE